MAGNNGSVFRTMKGTQVDMNKLINQNEMTIAVGNMSVNARGDKIGPGGKIVQRKEDRLTAPINGVPNQINVRQQTKDVSDMDPEGNE